MIQPADDRTPPMTPQLALRVAIIGTVALVIFGVIFFRLWFLQVLSSGQYQAEAQGNSVQHIPVSAPRGEILSSNGTALVKSVTEPSVEIAPLSLPVPVTLTTVESNSVTVPGRDQAVFKQLARVLKMRTTPHTCKYEVYFSGDKVVQYTPTLPRVACLVAKGVANSQYSNVTIKTDVGNDVQDFIEEHQTLSQFRGVLTNDLYTTAYPEKDLFAQVLGTVGAITSTEVNTKNFKGNEANDIVGQTGLEYQYNPELSGKDGSQGVKVNAQDQFDGYAKKKNSTEGDNLQTSLDLNLEKVGDAALQQSIEQNGGIGGSYVAIDPVNGKVYAMGSLPSYNANEFTHPISTKTYDREFHNNPNAPLLNRAIDGALPDGSTFKVITATAALESGHWGLDDTFDDYEDFCFSGECLRNSGGVHYGVVDLQAAIEVSDDEFFYNLGLKLNVDKPNGGALQKWAGLFGIGHTTGIDLPGEASGYVASPKLNAELFKQELECQDATGLYKGDPKHPAVMNSSRNEVLSGGCGIAGASYWTEGNNVEAAVGQGDDEVTPIQLAVVYAAIENGGMIVTPHIGESITSQTGQVMNTINPAPKRKLKIDSSYLDAIRQGLYLAANDSSGTSADVMGNFPLKVYGKTGTAKTGVTTSASSPEDAWYACYVPSSETNRPIVVVVNVQKGGFGDVAAAPVAREILSQWFTGKPGSYTEGSSAGDTA